MIEPRVSLKRARELLAERGDRVGQSALSRYLSKYSDVLDPRRDGRETTVDFEALAKHRSENINRTESAATSSPTSVSVQRGRADEAALNIRAQRQMCELEIAERIGALTPTRWPRCAMPSRLRSTISASAIANAFNLEARLVRPHLKAFEKNGLDAFARALLENDLVAALEPDEGSPVGARVDA